MNIEKNYIINENFMYMTGYHDRFGKLCSLVRENNRTLMVDQSPLEILSDSIRSIGFNLKGAIESAKWHLGNIPMCPFIVNPICKICVFPTKSANNPETIWFNPDHIKRTKGNLNHTIVTFSNGFDLKVPCRLSSFNTKLQNAEQLIKLILGKTPSH
ncbi:competence protein ComK [Neobacillus sedimentimangrovi]|uniref:Competence protein ComK n=1 Tax=Neobacillus sedimentimangrovi TaxID=2699460 RepID=A0ABS8QGH9_9BACI|nr:competence protein ComK [Neobacillus sedimentimangrovi]MCD4838339.1 competence protein ComK [Neobacillus sedimentimangrovi]